MRIWDRHDGLRDAPAGAQLPTNPRQLGDMSGHPVTWTALDNGHTVLAGATPDEPPQFADMDPDPGECLALADDGNVYLVEYADLDLCRECGDTLADGEGWDGLCGSHADEAERYGMLA